MNYLNTLVVDHFLDEIMAGEPKTPRKRPAEPNNIPVNTPKRLREDLKQTIIESLNDEVLSTERVSK